MFTSSDISEILEVGLDLVDDHQAVMLSMGYCDVERWDETILVKHQGVQIGSIDLSEVVSEDDAFRFTDDDEDIQEHMGDRFELDFKADDPPKVLIGETGRSWSCYWIEDGTWNAEAPERRVVFNLEAEGSAPEEA